MHPVFRRIYVTHESGWRPICIAMKFNMIRYRGKEGWSEKLVRRVLTRQGITPRD